MCVSWIELLTFCLVIVAVIELTARKRQQRCAGGNEKAVPRIEDGFSSH